MDLKALIAKMDQIESKKILTEGEDRPDAKKTDTTWTDKSGKKHPATRVQGSKSVAADKDADKERKKNDKDLEEMTLQSAIAKELLKEFNIAIEEEEVDEAEAPSGGTPNPYPPGSPSAIRFDKLTEPDKAWVTKGGGRPDIGSDEQDIMLQRAPNKGKPAAGAGTKPAVAGAPGAQDDATGVDAAVAAQQAGQTGGPTDAEIAANNAALGNWNDQPDTGAATKPAEPAAPMGGINPTVLNRYKELLDKLEGAGKKPAAAPAKPAAKPAAGAGTKPAAGGATMPAVDQMGNATGMPANESTLADDQILAIIRSI